MRLFQPKKPSSGRKISYNKLQSLLQSKAATFCCMLMICYDCHNFSQSLYHRKTRLFIFREKWAGAVRKCAFEVLVAAHVCGVRPRPDKAAGKLELSVLLPDSDTYQKLYTLSLLVDITYLGPRSAI